MKQCRALFRGISRLDCFHFGACAVFLCFCDTCALHGRISLANCKFGHWMLIGLELHGFVVFKDQQNLVEFFCILNLPTQEKHYMIYETHRQVFLACQALPLSICCTFVEDNSRLNNYPCTRLICCITHTSVGFIRSTPLGCFVLSTYLTFLLGA